MKRIHLAATAALALCLCSGVTARVHALDYAEDSLNESEYLFPNQQIVSSCDYRVVMQTDGNLVMYDWANRAIWNTNTRGTNNYAVVQDDGNFVVYNTAGQALWSAGYVGWATALSLQTDRNLVLYEAGGTTHSHWSSRTNTGAPPNISPCHWFASKMPVATNYDLPGGDYRHYTMAAGSRFNNCANTCVSESQCIAFTFVPAGVQASTPVCWLKSTLPPQFKAHNGMYSGLKQTYSQ